MWGMRVLIPKKLRTKLLSELHIDHPGATRMKSIARSYMWWPGLDKDIENMARACVVSFPDPSHGEEGCGNIGIYVYIQERLSCRRRRRSL